jgi:CTP synthase (UTP-ammonia lyase)
MKGAKSIPIGIVGDFDASRPTHVATEAGLSHAATALGVDVEASWLPTHALLEMPLESFAGFLIAPGSPYRSVDGALRAIRYARERARPLLGTCGGFQHVILEFARNVLGLQKAAHAEYEPRAAELVIEQLACSLSGQRAAVVLKPGSTAASYYGAEGVTEEYRCSFGLAASYIPAIERVGLTISGEGAEREPRIVELTGHPFYIATLFVPQLSSTPQQPHPLFRAFVASTAGALPNKPLQPTRAAAPRGKREPSGSGPRG